MVGVWPGCRQFVRFVARLRPSASICLAQPKDDKRRHHEWTVPSCVPQMYLADYNISIGIFTLRHALSLPRCVRLWFDMQAQGCALQQAGGEAAAEEGEAPKGIPQFWLNVLRNCEEVAEHVRCC